MKLFRLRRTPKSDEEERELVLDTDAEAEAEAPAPEGDLMTQISSETESEIEAEEKASEEDSLDPDLIDLFREAKNEVEESTLASELEDIAAQDLLTDLMGVSDRLRTTSWGRAKPSEGKK